MKRRTFHLLGILALLIAFAMTGGCDRFSLLEQFFYFERPPAPEDFVADGNTASTTTIELRWSYSSQQIDGFRILRSDGGSYVEVVNESSIGSSVRSYIDSVPSVGSYTYKMYAVYEEYLSLPTAELSAHSNPP